MKNYLLSLVVLITFSCTKTTKNDLLALNTVAVASVPEKTFYTHDEIVIPKPNFCAEPYQLTYTINTLENDFYELELQMVLNGDAHFVSPNSKIAYKGRFTLNIRVDENIALVGELNENPLTKEEIDNHPFVRGPVNWVRENTTYTQGLKVNTKEDFHVLGHIQFTIEPRCTLEVIPIIIKQKDGKLVVERDLC
jgi:hypothetical protein